MSNLSTLFEAMYNKLLTNTQGSPVFLTESTDIMQDMSKVTHRLELELVEADADFYASQRELPWEVSIKVKGYMKKITPNSVNSWTIADHTAIADFGSSVANLLFSLLDDKQAGLVSLPGFLYYTGKARLTVDMELFPGISVFLLQLTPQLQQNDTEM